uniref:Uncharacterized protein n=1 Tax=Rhizophora mucronata TaxID=61149 RepID=A0A2P2QNN3_RHIMU
MTDNFILEPKSLDSNWSLARLMKYLENLSVCKNVQCVYLVFCFLIFIG